MPLTETVLPLPAFLSPKLALALYSSTSPVTRSSVKPTVAAALPS